MKKHILLLVLFISCQNSNWFQDLGSGYSYLNPGGAMDVDTYSGDAITYKSLFEDPVIFPTIEKFKFNEKYIICKQSYDEKLSSELLQSAFEKRYHDIYYQNIRENYFGISYYFPEFKEPDSFYQLCSKLKNKNQIGFTRKMVDSIIRNNPKINKIRKKKINYYIINKEVKLVYGPLNFIEFDKIKKEKKIDLDF